MGLKNPKKTLLSRKTLQGPTDHLLVAKGQKPDLSLGKVNSSLHNYINETFLETYWSILNLINHTPY